MKSLIQFRRSGSESKDSPKLCNAYSIVEIILSDLVTRIQIRPKKWFFASILRIWRYKNCACMIISTFHEWKGSGRWINDSNFWFLFEKKIMFEYLRVNTSQTMSQCVNFVRCQISNWFGYSFNDRLTQRSLAGVNCQHLSFLIRSRQL